MVCKSKIMCVDLKVFLIRSIEKGEKSDVERRFGYSPSTVVTICKSNEKILQAEIERITCKRPGDQNLITN